MIGHKRQQLHYIGRATAPPGVGGDLLSVSRHRVSTQQLDGELSHDGILEAHPGPAQRAVWNGSGTVATVASGQERG